MRIVGSTEKEHASVDCVGVTRENQAGHWPQTTIRVRCHISAGCVIAPAATTNIAYTAFTSTATTAATTATIDNSAATAVANTPAAADRRKEQLNPGGEKITRAAAACATATTATAATTLVTVCFNVWIEDYLIRWIVQ